MPNLPFLLFAGILGYAAWRLKKHEEAEASPAAKNVAATASKGA